MKILELEFVKKGATFTQIKREGNLAIYQARRNASGGRWWEVAIIKPVEDRLMGSTLIPAYESYPSDEEIGRRGWACVSLARAEEKFEEVKGIQKNGKPAPKAYVIKGNGGKGRKPVLKPCICCAKEIYSSVYNPNKGKCHECLVKFPNPRVGRGRGRKKLNEQKRD